MTVPDLYIKYDDLVAIATLAIITLGFIAAVVVIQLVVRALI